jgi:hypothetical protein
VIARRTAKHAAPLLVFGETADDVKAAADLERRGRKLVLMLDEVPTAQRAGENRPVSQ